MLPFAVEHQISDRVSRLRDEAEFVRKSQGGPLAPRFAAFLRAVADRLEPTLANDVAARHAA